MTEKRIEIVSYDLNWPNAFRKEKKTIQDALGSNCVAIHHIGSTAVPGLSAKPKIDIIAAAKNRPNAISTLEQAGYTHRGEWNIPLKCGFTKRGSLDVNLHLFCDENHPEIEFNILFRDYLINNTNVRDMYADVKTKILKNEQAHQHVGKLSFPVYTLEKRQFIDSIMKDVGFERLRVLKCTNKREWHMAHKFRQMHFTRTEQPNLMQEIPDDDNNEHFLLYKGVEIVGYAHINITSELKARVCVFEVQFAEHKEWFLSLINEWIKVHDYAKF